MFETNKDNSARQNFQHLTYKPEVEIHQNRK